MNPTKSEVAGGPAEARVLQTHQVEAARREIAAIHDLLAELEAGPSYSPRRAWHRFWDACEMVADWLIVAVCGIVGSVLAVVLVACGCVALAAAVLVWCGMALVAAGPCGAVLAVCWADEVRLMKEDEP